MFCPPGLQAIYVTENYELKSHIMIIINTSAVGSARDYINSGLLELEAISSLQCINVYFNNVCPEQELKHNPENYSMMFVLNLFCFLACQYHFPTLIHSILFLNPPETDILWKCSVAG